MTKKVENFGYDVVLQNGEKGRETLSDILGNLLAVYEKRNNLKGINYFRQFGRIVPEIIKAKETGYFELDDADFAFLKELVVNDMIPSWGSNKGIVEVIEKFLVA